MKKNHRIAAGSHDIAGAFVFLQLGLFALLSVLLVLFGVQAYRRTVARSDKIGYDRILSAYLRSMVRAQDEEGSIEADPDMIRLSYEFDGTVYVTRIYVHDGMLREWFADENYDFRPEDGDEICEAGSLSARLENGLLHVEITDTDGDVIGTDIALRCHGTENSDENSGGEAA